MIELSLSQVLTGKEPSLRGQPYSSCFPGASDCRVEAKDGCSLQITHLCSARSSLSGDDGTDSLRRHGYPHTIVAYRAEAGRRRKLWEETFLRKTAHTALFCPAAAGFCLLGGFMAYGSTVCHEIFQQPAVAVHQCCNVCLF